MFFGRRDTLVTAASIIAALFKPKDTYEFLEEQYSKLGENIAASVSKGKRKMGKEYFDSLRNTYKVLSFGGSFTKHN